MSSDPRVDGSWTDRLPDPAPVVHRDLQVRVGGWDLTTLTREHLAYWVGCIPLQFGNTFIVVSRRDQPTFIQAYRNGPDDYDLEISDAPSKTRSTVVRDEAELVAILWAWLEGDRAAVDALDWEPSVHH
ncbi:hypothetical protein [Nocardia caishijiensis]|uniref:Immunity protein Imm1 n=1 Tax=Nocardia caishijiensis TaxID=184756 RepID=A0ABQ6YLP3_9NOCA|nr:hypothetical protein [Nocardia caishijiensis]KAF0846704.1 hypothetical protein FNL39_104125 [Nocardia caishijiensis]